MLALTIFFTIISVILFLIAHRQERESGLPGGRIIYADTSQWEATREPLYDPDLGLTGRPDYLVARGNQIIPIEIKSGSGWEGPFDSHIYQLAAYCLLVDRILGVRPSYGILHYAPRNSSMKTTASRTYAIDFTPELESATIDIIVDMQSRSRKKEIGRSHESKARCQKCGLSSICDQRLT